MLGSIDGCANFIDEKAARYETIINISGANGLEELLRCLACSAYKRSAICAGNAWTE